MESRPTSAANPSAHMSAQAIDRETGFVRELGLFDSAMVVIGVMIGSGIFINPYIVAQRLNSSELVIGASALGPAGRRRGLVRPEVPAGHG